MNLKAHERAQQILAAAATCFARRGFHRTTMDDIAREAGVSAGLIYRHYPGKDDLIVAMVQHHQEHELERIAAANDAPNLAMALRRLFDANESAEELRAEGGVFAEIIAEALRNPRIEAVVRNNSLTVNTALAALLASAQARGEIDTALDVYVAADLLTAIADGLLLQAAFTPNDAYIEQFERACHRMLGMTR